MQPAGPARRLLTTFANHARYAGRCNVCGHRGLFRIRSAAWDNLRETLDCPRCRSISRDRFMAAVISFCLGRPPILAEWPVDRSVLIREPSAYRGRAALLAEKVEYRPFRFPEENLEALTDADGSIDHLITADVFEHVRLDELAFREVYRVLKGGGYFFLQVPYSHFEHTRVLVEPRGDKDIFLCPPQYHDEHTLVYRIYGHDLLPRLEALGFSVGYVCQAMPRWGIPPMDMIVCRKDATLEDDRRHLIRFDRQWPR
jgi:SAM-dependent methyltransferase